MDGDNFSDQFAGRTILEAKKHGDITVQRVYCNVMKRKGWTKAAGFRVIHAGAAKNGADLLLSIEAVEMSYSGHADVFVICSSDKDFSHVAHHLRERSFCMVGIGEEDKAPDDFRKACSEFVEVVAKNKLEVAIADILRAAGSADGIEIALLGSRLGKRGFKISERKEKQWRTYLEKRNDPYACDPKGPGAKVRLRA